MTRPMPLALVAALLCGGASAEEGALGAYLYDVDCGSLTADAVVADMGGLSAEGEASEKWGVLGAAGVVQPEPFWAADGIVGDVGPDDLAVGRYAIAIHADDSEGAQVVACGALMGMVPFAADLAEVNDSGFIGGVAVEEAEGGGLRLVTGAVWGGLGRSGQLTPGSRVAPSAQCVSLCGAPSRGNQTPSGCGGSS